MSTQFNARLKWTAGFLLGVAVATAASAQTGEKPPAVPLMIERVALFKNGLGYFVSSGALPKKAKTVSLGQLPIPSFGTFWVNYGKDVKVRNLASGMERVEEQLPLENVGQLLQLNVGKNVVIRTGGKDEPPVEGILVKVAETPPRERPSPYVMGMRYTPDQYGGIPQWNQNSAQNLSYIVIIKTAQGTVTLNANSIVRADFEGQDLMTTRSVKYSRPSIRLELEQESDGGRIGVNYLARGITWSPSYLIDITDGKTAQFSAQAVIINEVADLQDVAVDLVTGFPNLKFADLGSPVAMVEDLAGFLNSLGNVDNPNPDNRRGGRYGYNTMGQQSLSMNNMAVYVDELGGVPSAGYSTAAEGMVSEDLFLYPLKAVTLKKGETAYIPLFTAGMDYKHIYTWKIGDFLNEEGRYQQQPRADGKKGEEVWHSCRLVNNMKMPLTTSAAQFVKDGNIVGQDVCYYTAPNAATTIRINRAMNVMAEQAEFEVERKRDAARFNGSSYDLVQLRGELKLRSRLDKPVNVEITKELSGEVLNTDPVAKDVMIAKGLKKVNATHALTWTIELTAGEETKVGYNYQVYVYH